MADQQAMMEADLIFQAKSGNEDAFGVLYQRHVDAIYAYIYKRVSSVCEAEDLSQTVFLKAWQAISNYQPSTTPFRAWLYRIAHNAVIDHYRTQKKSVQWEDLSTIADAACTPENALLETERQESVHRAVATLRPSYRDVITHRFLESKDYAETADALNRQVNNVRVLQHRALGALRRTLSQESALWISLVATALTLFFGTTIVEAASQALPDERLYPLRTLVENTRLAMADDVADVRLHGEFANRRLTDLETLADQERPEAFETTVMQLSSHITAASAGLADLHQLETDPQSRMAAASAVLEQLLHDQAASLAELELNAAPATQSILRPAIKAVGDARQRLDGDDQPAMPEPQPAAPAEKAQRDPQSDSPTQPLPAGSLADEAASATPVARPKPMTILQTDANAPSITPPETRGEAQADKALPVRGSSKQNPAVNDATVSNEDGEGIEARRAFAVETTPVPEPYRAADEASTAANSTPPPAQERVEEQEPSRPRQDQPSLSLRPLQTQSPSEGTQTVAPMSATNTLSGPPEGSPLPEHRDAPADLPADGEQDPHREAADETASSAADASDSANENQPSRDAASVSKPDRPDNRTGPMD